MLNNDPFLGYVKPGRIFGNIYFVGTVPASTHLIDTEEGLIVIDPGYERSLYLVINNIWELGFNPKDIKYIVLSHGHYDHTNAAYALAKLSGAKIFLGKEDLPFARGECDHFELKNIPFEPDVLLEDGDVIALGNTRIECMSTPGHTDGTISFFFDVKEGEKTYRAGMFGGGGTNTLTREFLESRGLPFENRRKFLESIERLEREPVEIFLGNHVENNDTVGKLLMKERSSENPFIDPKGWKNYLDARRKRLYEIIESER